MTSRLNATARVAATLLVLTLAGCARADSERTAGVPGSCPEFKPPLMMRIASKFMGSFPRAASIASSDTSSSIVIHPDDAQQIQCGKTQLASFDDVVFAKPSSGGDSTTLAMDILVPQTPGKKPLVIYVPGGGFVTSTKELALNLRTYLAEDGFVVASIQYRTYRNHANYRDGVADVKSAIRYLRAHAQQYGIDPTKVGIWGESAGGYLVSMVGLTNGSKDFDAGDNLDQSSAVQAVVDKFGPSDLSKVAADFDTEMQKKMAASDTTAYVHGLTPSGELKDPQSNPVTYVHAADPPFLIFHGSQDRLVSPSQTLMLHQALQAAGNHSTRYVVDGAGHGDMAFLGEPQSGLPWSTRQVMDITANFFKENLAK